MTPRRSIILIYYREPDYLRSCVAALEREFPLAEETEIIVVDNASGDGVAKKVAAEYPRIVLVSSKENLFYGKGANLGMESAHGDWFLIMNVDVVWQPGALRAFVADAEVDERVALAGPLVRYPDGRVQITARHSFPTAWSVWVDYCLPLQQLLMRFGHHPDQYSAAGHAHRRLVAHLTGVCLYVRRSVYDAVSGFDPKYTMYLEETDWQRAMESAKLTRWLLPAGTITHFGSAQKTFAQASPQYLYGLSRYVQKWWRGPWAQQQLIAVWWTSWFVSMVTLALAFLPSLIVPRVAGRVRHYLASYIRLGANLSRFRLTNSFS